VQRGRRRLQQSNGGAAAWITATSFHYAHIEDSTLETHSPTFFVSAFQTLDHIRAAVDSGLLIPSSMNFFEPKNHWQNFLPFFLCGSARLNHRERVMIKTNFPLGQVVATPNALSQLADEDIRNALRRHAAGDWGDCDAADWRENELSLREGFRLFSVYHSIAGAKFWVITEADRSATTVLMPEDY
jgi:hypothetical protein